MMDSYDNNNYIIIIVVIHSFIRIVSLCCVYKFNDIVLPSMVLHTPHTCTRHTARGGSPRLVMGYYGVHDMISATVHRAFTSTR